ncbi:TolC family protein [Luteirhabdus pelagi]|uniref:TolC family protein n=1 Tax=Luteirhabdus pelagi TaxID=2792783 RepID=UPI00193A0827|nr:TolC family protein [Luteirhabdus pelagi]
MNYRILWILFLLVSVSVSAQEVIPISQGEVLEKVSEQNLQLRIAAAESTMAQGDYQQTNAVFLPNITASHTGITTTNPLMAFGSKLNQEVLTQADFNPALLNDPDRIDNFATRIEVQQPLVNMDGIFQRKAAKAKWNAAQFQTQRTSQYLELEVAKAYMQLQLAYKNVSVLETTLKAAEENLRLANNSYEQGYLQQSDVLAVEVRVNDVRNQLQYAESGVANASDYLFLLMNEDSEGLLQPSDSLTVAKTVEVVTTLSENRADVQAMEEATEAYRQKYTADKMTFLPRLNAFGSYELYDDEIFQADANGYVVGASLSWDLFQGSKRFGATKKSKAEWQKSQFELEQYKAKSNLELKKAKRMYQDAKNNLQLAEKAVAQSKEALRIRKNRFEEGLEKTTDLLRAETQVSQKQLAYYQTVYQHNYALAYLQFLTRTQ